MTFRRFPKIGQFRDVINHVAQKTRFVGLDEAGEPIYDVTKRQPVLAFEGTIKLHGTNAAVVRNEDGSIHFQSRERIITPESDNAGFALWASTIGWEKIFNYSFIKGSRVEIFGEWCGGNIQSGVALNQLTKRFVIFKVYVDGFPVNFNFTEEYNNIFNIRDFQKFRIYIDFEKPSNAQNFLVERTLQVEECCPFAQAFGVTGVGEGIVWTCTNDPHLMFKTKGEKHSASKVKTLAPVDEELITTMVEFTSNTVTENRLNQGIDFLKASGLELSTKSTGDFIRWVYNDIITEEADVIVASQIDSKKLGGIVAKAAKTWFFDRLNNA